MVHIFGPDMNPRVTYLLKRDMRVLRFHRSGALPGRDEWGEDEEARRYRAAIGRAEEAAKRAGGSFGRTLLAEKVSATPPILASTPRRTNSTSSPP